MADGGQSGSGQCGTAGGSADGAPHVGPGVRAAPADRRGQRIGHVDAALAEALGEPADGAAVTEIIGTLTRRRPLRPDAPGPLRRQLDQARQEL